MFHYIHNVEKVAYKYRMSPYINTLVMVLIIVFVMIVASNASYFKSINKFYRNLTRIPQLLLIVATILSILGLTHLFDIKTLTSMMGRFGVKYPEKDPSSQISQVSSPKESGQSTTYEHKRNVTDVTKKIVAAQQKWTCGLCHRLLDETYEVDHVIPLYKGGTNDPSNLMALDPICHRKKTLADRFS
jgi:hypothetical protein